MSRVSGLIYAKNEEAWIAQAITSLQQVADEVVVADMSSVDRTAEIATAHGARVVAVPDFGYVEPARPLAENACRFDWVLNIDADEVLPGPLARRLGSIADDADVDAVRVPRLNFILGSAIRGTGWGAADDRHVRFYRRGALRHSSRIHERSELLPGRRVIDLAVTDDTSIWHFNYTGWDQFLEKLNRYTSVEAQEQVASGLSLPSRSAVAKQCAKTFLSRYIKHRGYRDGYRGLVLSVLMAVYRLTVYAKARQLATSGDSAAIAVRYRVIAADLASSGTTPKV